MKTESRMYEGVETWNPYVGCEFYCVYCTPSFQRQAKRRKKYCHLCYNYTPHFHPERLKKLPSSDVVFACAYGDVCWAKEEWIEAVIEVIRIHPEKEFYIQSKNPDVFLTWEQTFSLPDNLILGTTVETDLASYDTPSRYKSYREISMAPHPTRRLEAMRLLSHPRKYVTVEPILDFSSPGDFAREIEIVSPDFVYLGYDNHGCKLPEPPLHKTMELVDELEMFTEVRLKTIRKAWWESDIVSRQATLTESARG